MGERKNLRQEEINALRQGIDIGMTLIDTAEMYGEGLSEELVGEAIRGYHREDLFLVSKLYPLTLPLRLQGLGIGGWLDPVWWGSPLYIHNLPMNPEYSVFKRKPDAYASASQLAPYHSL